ncbi:MAG: leucyl/phenylalanyl-tRNA--protein transferase [Ignavibacteria bacterium]|nr:MAG: leucyl/phenylalanyl-tRNA--protein transferase [Ignavibacteria bacterium]KAF0156706.1 MAG: leucyl/phenylalanyl-tRNA--protein transferase [Ignavibacteria bacterium]
MLLSEKDLLKAEYMILMYSQGAFPMADENKKINWYLPEIRTIIPLENFNFPRSLRKFYCYSEFIYKIDTSIISVIRNCAKRETTWISDELIEAYKGLKKLGHLHSVEVFKDDGLVGGLYGVTYKGAFFGESMFSKVSQASKCALVHLILHLREKNFTLLDVQYQTEHLKMFGALEINFDDFRNRLLLSNSVETSF